MKLQQFTSFLGQWGWLILLGTAVAGITAYFINQNMTPVYEATAVWLIDEPAKSEAETAVSGPALAQTYAVLALTRPVLAETIERLDLPFDVDQLQDRVTAVVPPNTQILTIRVEDSDPARAARTSGTIGAVLADQNAARDSQRFAEPLANWQRQIDDGRAAVTTLESQLAAADVTDRPEIESNLADAQARYDNAFAEWNALLAQQAGESVMLMPLEAAQAAAAPIRPQTAAATIWAAVAGALAAAGVASIAGYASREQEEEDTAVANMPSLTMTSND